MGGLILFGVTVAFLIEVMRLFEDRAARYGTARTADRSPIADIHGRGCPAQRNTNLGLFSVIYRKRYGESHRRKRSPRDDRLVVLNDVAGLVIGNRRKIQTQLLTMLQGLANQNEVS
jgi:hypothetical protein